MDAKQFLSRENAVVGALVLVVGQKAAVNVAGIALLISSCRLVVLFKVLLDRAQDSRESAPVKTKQLCVGLG